MILFKKLSNFSKKIQKKLNPKIEFIALNFIFLFGLSISALIAKAFNKEFLEKKNSNSTWKKYEFSNNYKKMY